MPAERRSSYGPTSPVVGERGAATRDRIVETALELFAAQGYHATVMEDIAGKVGVSRATLYQYFASKESIFVELVEESGRALQVVARNIGPLGPSPDGLANLCAWLDSWAQVFDRYRTVFVEWANVNSPGTPLRPRMNRFVTSHTRHLAKLFADGGAATEPELSAVVLTGVIERFHYICAVHPVAVEAHQQRRDLALACQRTLFPDTPGSALSQYQSTVPEPAASPPPTTSAPTDRFDDLGTQATATVRNLLDAASGVFARYGHAGASVDQIVTAAGVARGTAYKYFDGCADIFGVLASECGQHMGRLGAELAAVDPTDPAALRAWLMTFLEGHHRYAGVLRAWTTTDIDDHRVSDARDIVLRAVFHAFGELSRAVDTAIRPHDVSARLMLVALLERTPDVATGTPFEPTDTELVETQAQFIERGLLGIVRS